MDKEEIKNYLAKWFERGRDYGKAPITKDMLSELERDGDAIANAQKVKYDTRRSY